MNRKEHLQWAKDRAIRQLEYDPSKPSHAYASMVSDLRKHPELENHIAIELGMTLMVGNHLGTMEQMKAFILGFN